MTIKIKDWLLHLKTWLILYGNIPKDVANHHEHVKQYFRNQEAQRKRQIKRANELIMSDIELDSKINRDQQNNNNYDNRVIVYYPNGSFDSLDDVIANRKEHKNE